MFRKKRRTPSRGRSSTSHGCSQPIRFRSMAMNEHEPLTRRAFLEQAAVVAAIGGLSVPHAPLVDARLIGSRLINGELDALSLANGWLNSPPLTAALLRGKVVLVQFWTFTCINWLRTLPYVRTWASKYRD